MASLHRSVRPKGLSTRQTTPRHLWLAALALAARGAVGARHAGARLRDAPAGVLGALMQARKGWEARVAAPGPRKRRAAGGVGRGAGSEAGRNG